MSIIIRTFNDPILKQRCEPIVAGEDLSWIKDLEAACYQLNGLGIAAPQIGIAKRAIFIRYRNDYGLTLINPVLSDFTVSTSSEFEGCLSYPGVRAKVERSLGVWCTWWKFEQGKLDLGPTGSDPMLIGRRSFGAREARVLQHEVDHLDGICRVGDAWREAYRVGDPRTDGPVPMLPKDGGGE